MGHVLNMSVYACVCVCVRMNVCICIPEELEEVMGRLNTKISVINSCIYIHLHDTCIYSYLHVCVYMSVYVYLCTYMYACIYITCIYMYMYITGETGGIDGAANKHYMHACLCVMNL